MQCCLRLLNRLSSPLQFPQILFLSSVILTPIYNFSPHGLKLTTNSNCRWKNTFLSLFSFPVKEYQRRARSFCTQAIDVKEAETYSVISPYLSVRICCNKDVAELLSEALICFGASSTSMDEVESDESCGDIWITSTFTIDQDVPTCLSSASDSVGLQYIPKYEVTTENPYDWKANIQETFHPTKITDGLWIIPKWLTPPELNAINITLDPGLAFGTGDHPTTKLCLLYLQDWISGGEKVFDYGTGSGILGIAALKMGAAFSIGIDVDPEAVTSAHQNIYLNSIDSNKMSVYLVPINEHLEGKNSKSSKLDDSKAKCDIVIANILLNPLIELVEDIVSYGRTGAIIGLTGILSEQVPEIQNVYSEYLENISVAELDERAFLYRTKKNNRWLRCSLEGESQARWLSVELVMSENSEAILQLVQV